MFSHVSFDREHLLYVTAQRRFRRAAFFLVSALSLVGASAAEWSVSFPEAPVAGALDLLETRWVTERPPHGDDNRIQLHRYRGAADPTASLLYLPGTNMNGEVAVEDEDYNLWLYLARRGVTVYTLDYRTHFVTSEELPDARFMAAWTMEAFVDDAREAVRFIRRNDPEGLLFVAGFSRGVWLGYGLVGLEEAGALAGLVVLDGGFKSYRGRSRHDFAAALELFEKAGSWASDVSGGLGWEARDRLMRAARSDPQGPAIGGDFETVGEQVASILYNAWRPGGLANPVDGLSRVEVLARLLEGYDRYYPAIQNLESATIADYPDAPNTSLDDRWGELELPILYFGATNMGADWLLDGIYSASKSGSKDVTIHVLENHGHLDVLVGERAQEDVFEVVLRWILQRASAEHLSLAH